MGCDKVFSACVLFLPVARITGFLTVTILGQDIEFLKSHDFHALQLLCPGLISALCRRPALGKECRPVEGKIQDRLSIRGPGCKLHPGSQRAAVDCEGFSVILSDKAALQAVVPAGKQVFP